MKKNRSNSFILLIIASLGLSACTTFSTAQSTMPTMLATDSTIQEPEFWHRKAPLVFASLIKVSQERLTAFKRTLSNEEAIGWIELTLLSKRYSTNTRELLSQLSAWQARYPRHPGNTLIATKVQIDRLAQSRPPQNIALILPLHGQYARAGRAIRSGFLNSYYANFSTTHRQSIAFYDDSNQQDIAALYQQAIAKGADFIIGPLTKDKVQQIQTSIKYFSVPTLALNYSNLSTTPNFYEFGLLPDDEARQLADRAARNGLLKAIVIAPDNSWGKRMNDLLSNRFLSLQGTVQARWFYTKPETFNPEIAALLGINLKQDKQLMLEDNQKTTLEQQRRQDFDVIFLFATPQEARLIVSLLRFYYTSNIPIYANSTVYGGKPNPIKDMDLNGVTVCEIPRNLQIAQRKVTLSDEDITDRFYALGQDAYLISSNLNRALTLPYFPLYGETGALTLSAQQIHRRLPCVTFKHGTL